MRIDLGQLSASDLQLDLPADTPSTAASTLHVSNAEALRGTFATTADGWQLSNLTAARVLLAKLHWTAGGLSLVSEDDAALLQVKAEISASADDIKLALSLAGLDVEQLQIATETLRVSAQIEGRGLKLESRAGVGLLTVEHVTFHLLELQLGTLTVAVPELVVTELVVDWSGGDFRLEAGTAEASSLSLTRDGNKLDGSGVALAALKLVGSQVRVGQLRASRLDVLAELVPAPAKPASSPERAVGAPNARVQSAPLFDYHLLDGLVGRLDVDVDADVAVPIIGHRRATHQFRIPIDRGAINYRELEHNLAPLEDSLIDFSVRDGALVLELGLPLINTRGRGKPILVWDLTPDDLALAEQQRVRLGVLPNFHQAGARTDDQASEPPPREDAGASSFKLLHLSFENVDAALRLLTSDCGASGLLRDLTFADLTVRGAVYHDPDAAPRGGALKLALAGLRTTLGELQLGSQKLKGRVEVAALRDVYIDFEDVRPTRVRAVAEGIALADLELSG